MRARRGSAYLGCAVCGAGGKGVFAIDAADIHNAAVGRSASFFQVRNGVLFVWAANGDVGVGAIMAKPPSFPDHTVIISNTARVLVLKFKSKFASVVLSEPNAPPICPDVACIT